MHTLLSLALVALCAGLVTIALARNADPSKLHGTSLAAVTPGHSPSPPTLTDRAQPRARAEQPLARSQTDDLVRTTLGVLRRFGRAHPNAPRVGVGDLSLPEGGYFGPEVSGGIGRATHQNGLDVDVYYPRLDRRERPPRTVAEVDVALAQELVEMFVAAGAVTIYVGPNLPLNGPPGVIVPLVNHDNHLHARIAAP